MNHSTSGLPVHNQLLEYTQCPSSWWCHPNISLLDPKISDIFVSCSVQFSSVTQSCLTLCDPMDCSMPDFPVHHQLLELAQTHVSCYNHASSPCEDTTGRLKFRTCFSLEFNHAGTQIWAFRLQNYEKWISVVYNPPSLGYFAVPVHVD